MSCIYTDTYVHAHSANCKLAAIIPESINWLWARARVCVCVLLGWYADWPQMQIHSIGFRVFFWDGLRVPRTGNHGNLIATAHQTCILGIRWLTPIQTQRHTLTEAFNINSKSLRTEFTFHSQPRAIDTRCMFGICSVLLPNRNFSRTHIKGGKTNSSAT